MTKQFVEVIAFFNDGGTIQSKLKEGVEWMEDRSPKWNFEKYNYRKLPRRFIVGIDKNGKVLWTTSVAKVEVVEAVIEAGGEVITVLELV
jgi:SpoVK/Ycf46/Vps4 family AAA+-type ATPase